MQGNAPNGNCRASDGDRGSIIGLESLQFRLLVRTTAEKTTVWLNPNMVDFGEPVRITINGNSLREVCCSIGLQRDVLAEDALTRTDRQRPFWAKFEWPEE